MRERLCANCGEDAEPDHGWPLIRVRARGLSLWMHPNCIPDWYERIQRVDSKSKTERSVGSQLQ